MVYFSFDRWTGTVLGLVPVRDHDRILTAKREWRIGESQRRRRRYGARGLSSIFSVVRTCATRDGCLSPVKNHHANRRKNIKQGVNAYEKREPWQSFSPFGAVPKPVRKQVSTLAS